MAAVTVNNNRPAYVPPGPKNYLSAISTQNASLGTPYNPTRVEGFVALLVDGITVAGGGNDEVYFSTGGIYNIQWSLQVTNNDNQAHLFYVWVAVNGNTVPNSGSVLTVHSTHGGLKGHMIAALNLFLNVNPGDYFNLVWTGDNTNIALETIPSPGNPVPASPAAILTIQKI